LVACAIQGVTPDARDLASNNCLQLFCVAPADPGALTCDDGLPDDVCGPAESELDVIFQGNAVWNELPSPLSESADVAAHTTHADAARLQVLASDRARFGDLINSLCRRNC
jgi:hypothetical protein